MLRIFPSLQSSRKKKDGNFPVRIGIYANNQTRYLQTEIYLDDPSQFNNGLIVNHPNAKALNNTLRKQINKLYYQTDNIEYVESLTPAEIIKALTLQASKDPRSLKNAYEEYITTARIKDSTKRLISNVYHTIEKCLGKNVSLQTLTYAHLMKYELSLRQAGNCNGTIRTKMAIFAKIVKYAEKARYVSYDRSPFSDYKYPIETVRDAWLTVEQIVELRDKKLRGRQATLRDYIILSYYLGGINAIDLLKINFKAIKKSGELRYIRSKTENMSKLNKYVSFTIQPEAWEIINRHIESDGFLGKPYHRYNNMHDFYAQTIKDLRKSMGIDTLVYYSGRKSFAQHAFQLGIHTGVIDYILGHKIDKGGSSLYNYIAITPEMATNAIRKVLDNLK